MKLRCASILFGVLLLSSPVSAAAQELASAGTAGGAPPVGVTAEKRGLLVPLYVSFAALQVLDVQSTRAALGGGAREANPLMVGLAARPVPYLALKVASGAAVIYASEKIRTRSRVGALVTMVALNSLYATIVSHNYAVMGH